MESARRVPLFGESVDDKTRRHRVRGTKAGTEFPQFALVEQSTNEIPLPA